MQKSNTFCANISKKMFFKFAPKRWSSVLFTDLTQEKFKNLEKLSREN